MEQWMFALAAFGSTAIAIGSYIAVLRARLSAAETELRRGDISEADRAH